MNESLEVLTCQAFGFYPKEIQATWRRDREVWKDKSLHRSISPNSDGTYYISLSIEIDRKERDRFRCHLEHEGLQEPLVLAFKEETATTRWALVGILAAVILGPGILLLIGQRRWRFRKRHYQEETTRPDQVSPERLPSSPSAKDEIQSLVMLHPTITGAQANLWRVKAPEDYQRHCFSVAQWRKETAYYIGYTG